MKPTYSMNSDYSDRARRTTRRPKTRRDLTRCLASQLMPLAFSKVKSESIPPAHQRSPGSLHTLCNYTRARLSGRRKAGLRSRMRAERSTEIETKPNQLAHKNHLVRSLLNKRPSQP